MYWAVDILYMLMLNNQFNSRNHHPQYHHHFHKNNYRLTPSYFYLRENFELHFRMLQNFQGDCQSTFQCLLNFQKFFIRFNEFLQNKPVNNNMNYLIALAWHTIFKTLSHLVTRTSYFVSDWLHETLQRLQVLSMLEADWQEVVLLESIKM